MNRIARKGLDFRVQNRGASQDVRVRKLRKRHGNDGYAAYFNLMDLLLEHDQAQMSLQDPEDLEIIADELHLMDSGHLLCIIESCVDLGLFNEQLWDASRIVANDELSEFYSHRVNLKRLPTHEWQRIRQEVFRRDNYTCQYCGACDTDLHCDHVFPVSKGGGNGLDNLITACARCNLSKSSKTIEEWMGGNQ